MKKEISNEKQFTPVAMSKFYDGAKLQNASHESSLVFTAKQKKLVTKFLSCMHEHDTSRISIITDRIADLEHLAKSIEMFPSLLEEHDLPGGMRTPDLLIDSLLDHKDTSDTTLQLPSKANLGKSFLIAKMHTFSSLSKQAKKIGADETLTNELQLEAVTMMFSLLAEDVYLNLIEDKTLPREFRREWAYSLLMIWEYRADTRIESVAPILHSVWLARRSLAPTFGTMIGTSELLLISMQLDDVWLRFIKQKLGDAEASQAMEEFLFGISYEQIQTLRTILKTKGITAINRDEVSNFLGETIKGTTSLDYRDFYSLYTIRRDDARARKRMNLKGPHKTLEDFFVQFITEEKNNDEKLNEKKLKTKNFA